MKTLLSRISLLYALTLIMGAEVSGQGINTLQIIPLNPSPEDNVKVIATVWLPSATCWLQQAGVSGVGQDVNVYAGYDAGLLTVICSTTDTVTLGRFNPGTYTCNYNLIFPYYTSAIDDMMSVNFTVSGVIGINEPSTGGAVICLLPLEGKGHHLVYQLPAAERASEISVYDLQGRLLKSLLLQGTQQGTVELSLPDDPGMIIITLSTSSGQRYSRRFPL